MKSFGRKTIKTHPDVNFNDMESNSLRRREKIKSPRVSQTVADGSEITTSRNRSESERKQDQITNHNSCVQVSTHTEKDINISLWIGKWSDKRKDGSGKGEIWPSPSLSNRLKASLNSEIWSSVSWSAISIAYRERERERETQWSNWRAIWR